MPFELMVLSVSKALLLFLLFNIMLKAQEEQSHCEVRALQIIKFIITITLIASRSNTLPLRCFTDIFIYKYADNLIIQ